MKPIYFLANRAEGNETYIFSVLRETKPTYFQCELADGRIKIFRVVRSRLRGTKQIWFLNAEAEGNMPIFNKAEGNKAYIFSVYTG